MSLSDSSADQTLCADMSKAPEPEMAASPRPWTPIQASSSGAEAAAARPSTTGVAVRPVTARTWQALVSQEGGSSPRVSLYNNDLFGQREAALLPQPPNQERAPSPQYQPSSARPATPRSAERLQQQRIAAPTERCASPSRLGQGAAGLALSTTNVPTTVPQRPPSSSSETAPVTGQQQQQMTAAASLKQQPGQQAVAATDTADPLLRPSTAPVAPPAAGSSSQRTSAFSLSGLPQQQRSGTPTQLMPAANSPHAPQLLRGFSGAVPAGSLLGGGCTGSPRLGCARGGNGPRPSTPSFQPVTSARPATAAAGGPTPESSSFRIKAAGHLRCDSDPAANTAGAGAADGAACPAGGRREGAYPLPPRTAPPKADLRGQQGQPEAPRDALAGYGILTAAFVATAAKGAAAARGEIEPAAAAARDKAALRAMLHCAMLASADLADASQLRRFLLAPGPVDRPMQCCIQRSRGGLLRGGTQYRLVLEQGGGTVLAAARRRGGSARGSSYAMVLGAMGDAAHGSPGYLGKLRSNFLGTEFVLHDGGAKPQSSAPAGGWLQQQGGGNARCELGAVLYEPNLLGTKGPRRMTALLPKLEPGGEAPLALAPRGEGDSLLGRYRGYALRELVVLRNRPPRWNEALGAYCLNFGGRVTQASVKNFQLVAVDNMDRIILQFGRTGRDSFALDYAYPLTALQAFALCLSSLDSKLACE